MKIDKVVIACFNKDIALLRTCVASVRYWYPDIDIYLLKDTIQGDFSVDELKTYWNCKIYPSTRQHFGWGWSILEVLTNPEKGKCLFLDSDTVLLGRVIDKLNEYDEDFVVTGVEEKDERHPNVNNHYIDMSKIGSIDNGYKYPGYVFNTGQIVLTSGIFSKADCSEVIEFDPLFKNKYPDVLRYTDQGTLNYILHKAQKEEKVTVRYDDFWIWPGLPKAATIHIQNIRSRTENGYPFVLHWAGIKPVDFRKYLRYDIISFYDDFYYGKIPMGYLKRTYRHLKRLSIARIKIAKYKIFKQNYV
ncbi:MAG TPA: glycosyltransferase [Flavipsychrobacter sp.]|nr:glycosyltransferase [Flavipsychrobacter sp.]